ncbi:PTS galactitol transporter subunit IIC, partial [Salmonella enterica subsp. enterica serovar Poona]
PFAAITWRAPIAPFLIPLPRLINVAMLALNKTRTVDVDMWNYWHFALAGTLVYYSTGSFVLGLFAAAIAAIVVLKLAAWSAPLVATSFGLEGISLPPLAAVVFLPRGLRFESCRDT